MSAWGQRSQGFVLLCQQQSFPWAEFPQGRLSAPLSAPTEPATLPDTQAEFEARINGGGRAGLVTPPLGQEGQVPSLRDSRYGWGEREAPLLLSTAWGLGLPLLARLHREGLGLVSGPSEGPKHRQSP